MSETDNTTPEDQNTSVQPGVVVMPDSESVPASSDPAPPEEKPEPVPQAEETDQAALKASTDTTLTWTASEFIAHDKSAGWYFALALMAVAAAAIIYLITKDKITPVVVLVAAAALGYYASRKPRQVQYILDDQGINVAGKHFVYETFRCFAVVPEGAFKSIVFMPLKRFGLPLTLYYPPEDEDKIVSMLSDRLPVENRQPDFIDKLMHRIRF